MIAAGYVGDGVLIPEYLCDRLAVAGRGQAVFKISISRPGPPIHEVYRPEHEPSVIAVGAELVRRFSNWQLELKQQVDPIAGCESVFIGQIHAGEIYNQYPQLCWLEGTRRWLPGEKREQVEAEFRRRLADLASETGTTIEAQFQLVRDAFRLDVEDPLVANFDRALLASGATALPRGAKPFVDDGNTFWHQAGVPAITHGPRGGGAHTLNEWVSIDELVRVALVYAATAVSYCA
jgi:acetylornithine deacetylase/succinyl-diaminopimelate desuccinylase-like protein